MSDTTNINEMLEGRATRYGTFEGHARISQDLKAVMHERSGWDRLKPDQREAQKARMVGADLSRLLYVAITRAAKHCVPLAAISVTSAKLAPVKTITPMRQWMAAATVEEQELLAQRVGTSRGVLYQLASGHRSASAGRAQAIERETRRMARASKGRLPVVYRTDLCEACRSCDFAHRCLGEKAVASEFPIADARLLELGL